MLGDLINNEIIGAKGVYSFEKHHCAMLPWHELRQNYGHPLRLLTLDYHTDTMIAFRGFACRQIGGLNNPDENEWRRISQQAVADICLGDTESINQAVTRLRFDEHIDAALKSGILDLAFVISHEDDGHIVSNEQRMLNEQNREQMTIRTNGNVIVIPNPLPKVSPPFNYSIPKNGIIILENNYDYPWLVHDDEQRGYKDAVIESRFLSERLTYIDDICRTGGTARLFDDPFILDIDLDYFNTQKSIAPDETSVFYELIRHAVAITIARESGCVQSCQIEGEGLTSEYLEQALKLHIQNATQ